MYIIWLLGGLAVLSLICSFILEYIDQKDKRKRIWGYRAADMRRFMTMTALFLGILTVLLEIKDKIDDKLEAIDRQTALLDKLAKIINNTDPIRGSTLEIGWDCADTISYHALQVVFTHPRYRVINDWGAHHNDYTIIDSSASMRLLGDVRLYFLDSLGYSSRKDDFFTHSDFDDYETPLLQKANKYQLGADYNFNVLTITDHSEEAYTDGTGGLDTSKIYWSYRFNMKIVKNVSQNWGFSDLSRLYCLMTMKQWPNHKLSLRYYTRLNNWDSSKTITLYFKKEATFRKKNGEEFQIYVSKVAEMRTN